MSCSPPPDFGRQTTAHEGFLLRRYAPRSFAANERLRLHAGVFIDARCIDTAEMPCPRPMLTEPSMYGRLWELPGPNGPLRTES